MSAKARRSILKDEARGVGRMLRRQRVADAILAQVVADAHLAAETIAAPVDGHMHWIVRECVHEHRHVKSGKSYCIGNGALVAKIRQRHEYAVYLVTVLPEHLATQPSFRQGLNRAVGGGVHVGNDRVYARFLQGVQNGFTALGSEMVREEAPVTDDHAQRDGMGHWPGTGLRARLQRRSTSHSTLLLFDTKSFLFRDKLASIL